MNIERPMLFSATITLVGALVQLGIDRAALAAEFRQAAYTSKYNNSNNGAATLEMLAKVAETYFVASPPF